MPNDKGTLKHELFYYEGKKKIFEFIDKLLRETGRVGDYDQKI